MNNRRLCLADPKAASWHKRASDPVMLHNKTGPKRRSLSQHLFLLTQLGCLLFQNIFKPSKVNNRISACDWKNGRLTVLRDPPLFSSWFSVASLPPLLNTCSLRGRSFLSLHRPLPVRLSIMNSYKPIPVSTMRLAFELPGPAILDRGSKHSKGRPPVREMPRRHHD